MVKQVETLRRVMVVVWKGLGMPEVMKVQRLQREVQTAGVWALLLELADVV
jgi:hypothetical protein